MGNVEDGDGWWAQVGEGDIPMGGNRSVSSSSIDGGGGAEYDMPLYIGVGTYLVSLLLGTWMASWGSGLSGLEALQTSVDLLLDWPGMFSSTVAFNQEFLGLSYRTSLLLTFNWFLWDSLPLMLLVFLSLRIYRKEGVGIGGRAFLYYLVLLFATDILAISFVNSMGEAVSYPLDILDWRSWEIVAMIGIFMSYFGRSISVRMHSKELDELY
ncbi:MAG: hypothetical protein CL965_00005 [Euryarchaeota archaeon]|nr:hypothetical protein [Euryarchaeota archaeon]